MAIAETVPGIEVTILVDGEIAEYDDVSSESDGLSEDEEGGEAGDYAYPHVVKYIEAKLGAPVVIYMVKDATFDMDGSHHLKYRLEVDNLQRSVWERRDERSSSQGTGWTSAINSTWTGNPQNGYNRNLFQFVPLHVVPCTERPKRLIRQDMERAKSYGRVVISIFRMLRTKEWEESNRNPERANTELSDVLCKTALSGRAPECCIGTVSEPMEPPVIMGRWEDDYDNPLDLPFVVFEFRYRTRKELELENIVPRPTPAERVAKMTEEELRRNMQRVLEEEDREASQFIQRLKRGYQEQDEDSDPRHHKQRRLSNDKFKSDLTED